MILGSRFSFHLRYAYYLSCIEVGDMAAGPYYPATIPPSLLFQPFKTLLGPRNYLGSQTPLIYLNY